VYKATFLVGAVLVAGCGGASDTDAVAAPDSSLGSGGVAVDAGRGSGGAANDADGSDADATGIGGSAGTGGQRANSDAAPGYDGATASDGATGSGGADGATGALACGNQTCGPDQLCLHPCAGVGPQPPPQCAPLPAACGSSITCACLPNSLCSGAAPCTEADIQGRHVTCRFCA
jgi:hypothetical protein